MASRPNDLTPPELVTAREFSSFVRSARTDMREVRKDVKEIKDHLRVLNGGVEAAATLKRVAPQLVKVAEKLDPERLDVIVKMAEDKADDQVFWRGVRRRLSPLKPLGALLWAFVMTTAAVAAWETFGPLFHSAISSPH